jgi:iron complex outermembrane receptor protein
MRCPIQFFNFLTTNTMSIKNIILTFLCLTTAVTQAQNINGTVKTATGEAVAFAHIMVLNNQTTTVADKEGSFTLNLPSGKYTMQVSAVGFATQVREFDLSTTGATVHFTLVESTRELSEVVVTATKKEEENLNVPTSVTSISAKKLEDTRTWGLGGLTALVPNYNYQELGVPFQQVQSIRGIQVFSENPAVSTYIDDVNNIDILANGFALTDIERIEVLRGPQGTLFGRNAMGGVVNIITKKPTNRTSAFAEASVGNLGLGRYGAGFKTPLIKDKLFFGLNGLYQSQDGYWKNDTTGANRAEGSANGKTVGGEKNLYGNMFLKWLVSKRFDLTLNIKGQRDWSENSGFFVSQANERIGFANPDRINLARIGEHERNILNSSLVAKYYGSKFTFTSISAYQTIDLSFKNIDFPGFFHSFYKSAIGEKLPPQQVYSQEFRVSSSSKTKLQYTAGLYAFSQVGYEPSTNLAFESNFLPDTYIIFRNRSNNFGIAGFGEASYQLTQKLKATAGLRYDYESREATFNGFGDATFSGGVVTETNPDTTVSGNYSAISPKFALSYAIDKGANLYLSYTRGFRAGGVNAQKVPAGTSLTFDPEYSDNYEIGYKSIFANNRLSVNASTFLIQWQSLQFFNLVAPGTIARDNVGDAISTGVEIEVAAIPLKGLQIDASFGVNETVVRDFNLDRVVNFVTGEVLSTPVGGKRLSNAPSRTLFIGAQYEAALGKKLKAIARAEVRNIGNYFTDVQNTIRQPDYTLFNSRVGLRYAGYGLFFWGQNLSNERFLAFGSQDSSFGRSVRTAAPRTFGVTFSAQF